MKSKANAKQKLVATREQYLMSGFNFWSQLKEGLRRAYHHTERHLTLMGSDILLLMMLKYTGATTWVLPLSFL